MTVGRFYDQRSIRIRVNALIPLRVVVIPRPLSPITASKQMTASRKPHRPVGTERGQGGAALQHRTPADDVPLHPLFLQIWLAVIQEQVGSGQRIVDLGMYSTSPRAKQTGRHSRFNFLQTQSIVSAQVHYCTLPMLGPEPTGVCP